MLNPGSPVPLYLQLAAALEESIRKGEFRTGDVLPSENALSARYKIGRPTVRQAFDVLDRKGFLDKRRGSGTYIKEPRSDINIFTLAGTSAAFQESGISLSHEIIEGLKTIEAEEPDVNPFAGIQAYYFSRIDRIDGLPVLFERFFLDRDLFRGIEKYRLEGQSLAELAEKEFFLKPAGGRQSFSVVSAAADIASVLALKAAEPLLLIRRTIDFTQKTGAVFSEIYCRTDRYAFTQELTSGGNL